MKKEKKKKEKKNKRVHIPIWWNDNFLVDQETKFCCKILNES